MTQHANMVKVTAASPGTSTITVSTAVSGFRTFATAFGSADAVVAGVRIQDASDATKWEIARGCSYTYSTNALSRGTFESSSTGSVVDFTGSVIVSVIETAGFGNNAALNHVAGSDADTTMAVGNMYVTDMSAWATADRTYTLPATAAVGDRIGIMVTAGDASHELIITAATSDTLNGVAGGTEWSRLFITGEVVILRCVTADSAWLVEYDGRIQQNGSLSLTTSSSGTMTADEWYLPTDKSGAWSVAIDNASLTVTGTGRIYARRAGNFIVTMSGRPGTGLNDQKYFSAALYRDGVSTVVLDNTASSSTVGTDKPVASKLGVTTLTAGQYINLAHSCAVANVGAEGAALPRLLTAFSITEIL